MRSSVTTSTGCRARDHGHADLVAILTGGPERRRYVETIEAAKSGRLSTAAFVEISIVIESRYGADGLRDLSLFLACAGVELVAVDSEQAELKLE